MYYYIINPHTPNSNFYTLENKLKSRLRELNIDGEMSKTLYEGDVGKLTKTAIDQGAQTIVVMGDDKTINNVVSTIDSTGKTSIAIGVIPIDSGNSFSKALGINSWEQACSALSSRRLQNFHIMYLNDRPFLHYCRITPSNESHIEVDVQLDGESRLQTVLGECNIANTRLRGLNSPDSLLISITSPAEDEDKRSKRSNKLEPAANISQLQARLAVLEANSQECLAQFDGQEIKDSIFRIRLSHKPIKLITALKS